jgi:hypothetical protein
MRIAKARFLSAAAILSEHRRHDLQPAGRRSRGDGVLEPQSTALFILLMVVFCALVCWMALARQMVFRVFAACLAFIPAMLFGVAAVNKYYDYYQSWGAVAADLGGQGTSQVTSATSVNQASARQVSAILGSRVNLRDTVLHGQTRTSRASARRGSSSDWSWPGSRPSS